MDRHTDAILETLALLIANLKGSIPITLTVSGFLVTGDLIGGRDYFDILISHNKGGDFEESLKVLQNSIYPEPEPESDNKKRLNFVHLKNAYFFSSGNSNPIPTQDGFLWRGKLSDVSGFSLGKLEVA